MVSHTLFVTGTQTLFFFLSHTHVSFIHIQFLIVYLLLLPKLFPISSNLMTEWFWRSSSFGVLNREVCFGCERFSCVCSVYMGSLLLWQSKSYWQLCLFGFEDNMQRALRTKKNTPRLNVLDWGGGSTGFDAWGFSAWGDVGGHICSCRAFIM